MLLFPTEESGISEVRRVTEIRDLLQRFGSEPRILNQNVHLL